MLFTKAMKIEISLNNNEFTVELETIFAMSSDVFMKISMATNDTHRNVSCCIFSRKLNTFIFHTGKK